MTKDQTIAFIGIGAMGWPMAENLIRAGWPVAVHDADGAQQQRFVAAHGARAPESLAELGRDAEVVITMLPTGQIVRHVLLEAEDGALAGALRPGSTVIDMSSSDPTGTRELAAAFAPRGVTLVDAPVSGGVPGAREARLTIMIGSDDDAAVERVRPILAAMGRQLYRTGGSGTGHAMKALNNYIAAAGFTAAIEALLIGSRFGLDPTQMVEILNKSTGRNFSTEMVLAQQVISRDFASGFMLGLLAKDVKIAADLAEDIQVNAPLSRLTRDLLLRARECVGATADHSAAIKYWEKLNGITV